MPQSRIVVLNYDPANHSTPFGPTPRQIPAGPNDTIQFRIGDETRAAHSNCRLRITLHRSERFSNGILQHGPGQDGSEALPVTLLNYVSGALAGLDEDNVISGYRCELLDANGQPIPGMVADGAGGGEIVPDTTARLT
jgi:hypothetical protein